MPYPYALRLAIVVTTCAAITPGTPSAISRVISAKVSIYLHNTQYSACVIRAHLHPSYTLPICPRAIHTNFKPKFANSIRCALRVAKASPSVRSNPAPPLPTDIPKKQTSKRVQVDSSPDPNPQQPVTKLINQIRPRLRAINPSVPPDQGRLNPVVIDSLTGCGVADTHHFTSCCLLRPRLNGKRRSYYLSLSGGYIYLVGAWCDLGSGRWTRNAVESACGRLTKDARMCWLRPWW